MQINAVWNTAPRLRLNNQNPAWVRDLACDIPKANWRRKNISNNQFSMPATQELKMVLRSLKFEV